MTDRDRQALEECDDDMVALYLKTAAAQIKLMIAAERTKSFDKIHHLSHKLSGSTGFLGLQTLAKLLKELEQAAWDHKLKEINRLLGMVKEKFGQLSSHPKPHTPKIAKPLVVSRPPTAQKRTKVFIVDDHPLIREGL